MSKLSAVIDKVENGRLNSAAPALSHHTPKKLLGARVEKLALLADLQRMAKPELCILCCLGPGAQAWWSKLY